MESTCCSFAYNGDPPDVFSAYMPRARKEHACCECGRTIAVGETYERARGLWDERWREYKTCLGCQRLRDDVACEGFVFEALAETVWECLGVDIVMGEVEDDEKWARAGRPSEPGCPSPEPSKAGKNEVSDDHNQCLG